MTCSIGAVQQVRVKRAAAIVAAAFCAVALSGPVESAVAYAASAFGSLAIEDGSGNEIARFDIDQGVAVSASVGEDVPADVRSEVWLPADDTEVYSLASGGVVGYVVAGDAQSVQQEFAECMEQLGWSNAEVGGLSDAVALYKDCGACRYVLATFSQVEGDVVAVLRIEGEE